MKVDFEPVMTKEDMLKQMCRDELAQADVKAIGRSRGFDREVIASRDLLQHMFLSEQGVGEVLGSLTEPEILGLHLLHHLGEAVDVEFFARVYPDSIPARFYGLTYTERFKNVLQKVKANLVRRGILLLGTIYQPLRKQSVTERLRFRFPEEFGPLLPGPVKARRVAPGAKREYRQEVMEGKLAELVEPRRGRAGQAGASDGGRWELKDGELLFDGKPFRAARFRDWPVARLAAAFSGASKRKTAEFRPVPLLLYALFRLGEEEWLVPDDLLPLWKMGLAGNKVPEPINICEAGFQWGLLEEAELEGAKYYRWRGWGDATDDAAPDKFVAVHSPQEVRIDLSCVPLKALEQMSQVSHLKVESGSLRAEPALVKISHAPAETLESPVFGWLREHHPAFKETAESVERKRGKLMVHENLLVAKVTDPALKVMLEKQFGAPGQLVELSNGFVAFPAGLLPKLQAWMKKSGHVIKTVCYDDTD